LLQAAGIEPIVHPSDVDESQLQAQEPVALANELAQRKAAAVAPHYPGAAIVGCDSVLALDGAIYGKPDSPEVAIARWQSMRGRAGVLCTGHALLDRAQDRQQLRCGQTTVHFAPVSDRAIEAYVASGEPLACAGGFALEGRGGWFVERIEGCHSNVIGLSLPLLRQMLEALGYAVPDFWPA